MKLAIIAVFVLFIAGCAMHQSEPKVVTKIVKTSCHFKKEQRDFEIYINDTACEVIYRKGGIPKSVADAVNGPKYCYDVVENMRSNLERQGWKCQ